MLARLPEPYVPPDGASLLALWDGEPVGWVFLHRRDQQANAIEMKHLFVLDGWRRRGIGTTLVAPVVAQAQQLGAAVLFLDVDESRHAAIRLYEAFGFLPTEPFNEGWPGARWCALPLTGT
jgi:putative acetyltransferase